MLAQVERRIAEPLYSLRRRDTAYTLIAERLRNMDASQKECTLIYDGEARRFSRHANGGGWVEEGAIVKESTRVTSEAVVMRNSTIHDDVVVIYGGKIGNTLGYADYE